MNVDILVCLIKNLLEEGKGGLFIVLERAIKGREMEKIFVDGNEDHSSIYKRTVLKDERNTRIKNHNFEYLKLISKVDGAVTLDSEFNLLSFGRLVKLDMNGSKQKVEGARTAAAISGSKYGLAIKVSEDKKITVWEDGIKVLEI
jgi:DNA integrity scanning protein DisA with diadenylate cyclase activity